MQVLPVPPFLPHFAPGYHLQWLHMSFQDPAGNLDRELADIDGTFHVFPCCSWEHFASTDFVHWHTVGPTILRGGTGSMAARAGGSVIAMAPQPARAVGDWGSAGAAAPCPGGATMYVANDTVGCSGERCRTEWVMHGVVATQPPHADAGFRDPARPFNSSNGSTWMVVGGGVKGSHAEALLYRATTPTLGAFEFAGVLHSANRTFSASWNEAHGFFDMMECPDFFPLGPYFVLISSAYMTSQPP